MIPAFLVLYFVGFLTCLLLCLYEIGSAPDHVAPPPIHIVLFIALFWPLFMPLAAYVSWAEENRGKRKA